MQVRRLVVLAFALLAGCSRANTLKLPSKPIGWTRSDLAGWYYHRFTKEGHLSFRFEENGDLPSAFTEYSLPGGPPEPPIAPLFSWKIDLLGAVLMDDARAWRLIKLDETSVTVLEHGVPQTYMRERCD